MTPEEIKAKVIDMDGRSFVPGDWMEIVHRPKHMTNALSGENTCTESLPVPKWFTVHSVIESTKNVCVQCDSPVYVVMDGHDFVISPCRIRKVQPI